MASPHEAGPEARDGYFAAGPSAVAAADRTRKTDRAYGRRTGALARPIRIPQPAASARRLFVVVRARPRALSRPSWRHAIPAALAGPRWYGEFLPPMSGSVGAPPASWCGIWRRAEWLTTHTARISWSGMIDTHDIPPELFGPRMRNRRLHCGTASPLQHRATDVVVSDNQLEGGQNGSWMFTTRVRARRTRTGRRRHVHRRLRPHVPRTRAGQL